MPVIIKMPIHKAIIIRHGPRFGWKKSILPAPTHIILTTGYAALDILKYDGWKSIWQTAPAGLILQSQLDQ